MGNLVLYATKLLRLSERYFKTDMIYLAQGSFWLTLLQGISSLGSFLLAIAFANLVSPVVYGTYRYILSVASFLRTLSLTGLAPAVIQSVARGLHGSLEQAFWLNLKWSWVTLFSSLGVALYYFSAGELQIALAFVCVGIFTPLLNSTTLFSYFLTGKKDFKRQSIYGAINATLPAFAVFVTMLMTENVLVLVLSYLLAQVIVEFTLYRLTLRYHRPNKEELDASLLSYSAHMSVMNIIETCALRLDSVLIFHYFGPAQLAIHSFATAIPEQIRAMFRSLSNTAFPKWSTRPLAEIRQTLWHKMGLFLIGLTLTSIVYILIAPYLFALFFPAYIDAIVYSQIFSLAIVAGAVMIPLTVLQSQKMTHELYYFTIIISLTQILLLIIFVPPYGIIGAILSILSARFVGLVLGSYFVGR